MHHWDGRTTVLLEDDCGRTHCAALESIATLAGVQSELNHHNPAASSDAEPHALPHGAVGSGAGQPQWTLQRSLVHRQLEAITGVPAAEQRLLLGARPMPETVLVPSMHASALAASRSSDETGDHAEEAVLEFAAPTLMTAAALSQSSSSSSDLALCNSHSHSHSSGLALALPTIRMLLRLEGGKGGFGTILRSLGAKFSQVKTTNFDACRDLSGRRVRHINTEKQLADFISKQQSEKDKEEREAEERKLQKQHAVLRGPNTNFDHQTFVAEIRTAETRVDEAVNKGVERAAAIENSRKHKADEPAQAPAKRIRLLDEDLSGSDLSDEELEDEDEDEDDTAGAALTSAQTAASSSSSSAPPPTTEVAQPAASKVDAPQISQEPETSPPSTRKSKSKK